MEEANQSDIPAYSSPKETSDLLSVYHFCEDAIIAPTVFPQFLGGWIGFGVAAEELSSQFFFVRHAPTLLGSIPLDTSKPT